MAAEASSSGPPSDQKWSVRLSIWRRMEKHNLLVPFEQHNPANQHRIPYYKGCHIANGRLASSEEFKEANVVKVNPSLAQMTLRKTVLTEGKTLLVPTCSLDQPETLFRRLDGLTLTSSRALHRGATKKGAEELGEPVGLQDLRGLKLDLFVVGSVAVSRQGVRLGKGKGFAELEWAILYEAGAVDENTLVATTVHEAQLGSEANLPASILSQHDLPVDLIATPRRLLRVSKRLAKPKCGILWHLIKEEDLEAMPILREMKEQSQLKG